MKNLTPRQRFGRRIRRLRVKVSLTQLDVAKSLGYGTAQFISNNERGISYPSNDSLPKLARVLQTNPGNLVSIIYAAKLAELMIEQRQLMREVSQ